MGENLVIDHIMLESVGVGNPQHYSPHPMPTRPLRDLSKYFPKIERESNVKVDFEATIG